MSYDSDAIYERDGWRCALCGVRLATTVHSNHPLAPTVEHIVARVRGGGDEPSNLQAAHRRCNSAKGISLRYEPALGHGDTVESLASPDSALMRDFRTWLRERNPRIAAEIDRRFEDGEDPALVPAPDLAAEQVGPVFDEAVSVAKSYVESVTTSDELEAIVRQELNNPTHRYPSIGATNDLIEITATRMGITLKDHIPDAAGLSPIWGLQPFDQGMWPALAAGFLHYARAEGLVFDALMDVLFDLGEATDFEIQRKIGNLWMEASGRRDADELVKLELLLLEIVDLEELRSTKIAESEWGKYIDLIPRADSYAEVAEMRETAGNLAGEIEILERYESAVGTGEGVGPIDWNLLKRLEVRRSRST